MKKENKKSAEAPDGTGENSPTEMKGFWESSFAAHKAMWGFEPTRSAILAKELFLEKGIREVLVPGIGYGRNARVFLENGIAVTGIEISETAIELARENYGKEMQIFLGSVTDMPLEERLYEGVFCYGLVYLLNRHQRKKLIADCYNQLKPGGWMVFSVVSKNSPNYGKGKEVEKDTFEQGKGGRVFFYDMDAVRNDFGNFGLQDALEVEEPDMTEKNRMSFRFILIKCRKAK